MTSTRGLLIIFEGPNYVGKTTIINYYLDKFNNNNNYKLYKFPNRSTITGKKIDEYLKNNLTINSIDERIKLFADNRKEQLDHIINDLNSGINVICDRYIFSGIVYPLYDLYVNHYDDNIIDLHDITKLIQIWLNYDKNMPKPDVLFIINSNFNRNENERFHFYDKKKLCHLFCSLSKLTNTKFEFLYNEKDKLDLICNGINTYLKYLQVNTLEYF